MIGVMKPEYYYCLLCLQTNPPLLGQRVVGKCRECGDTRVTNHLPGFALFNFFALAKGVKPFSGPNAPKVIPEVRAGQTYCHYKGRIYFVLSVADYTGEHGEVPGSYNDRDGQGTVTGFHEGEKLVTYIGLYDNPHGNRPCSRPLSEWVAMVDVPAPQEVGPDGKVYDIGVPTRVQRYKLVTS